MWFTLFVLSLASLTSKRRFWEGGGGGKGRNLEDTRARVEKERRPPLPHGAFLAPPTKNEHRHVLRRLSPAVQEGFSLSTSDFFSSHIRTFSNSDGHFQVIQSFLMKTVESLHNAVNDLETAFYWSLLLSLNVTFTFCHSSP